MVEILSKKQLANLPATIPFSETVFSPMNLFATAAVLTIIPLLMFIIGKYSTGTNLSRLATKEIHHEQKKSPIGAEKIDYSALPTEIVGSILLLFISLKVVQTPNI